MRRQQEGRREGGKIELSAGQGTERGKENMAAGGRMGRPKECVCGLLSIVFVHPPAFARSLPPSIPPFILSLPSTDPQSVAVLGVAMVAMGEPLGTEMATRIMFHLVQYGDPHVRRAVPLALAMLSVSNPGQSSIVDTLSKLSHDQASRSSPPPNPSSQSTLLPISCIAIPFPPPTPSRRSSTPTLALARQSLPYAYYLVSSLPSPPPSTTLNI